mgnify:CR=1 FL=1
MPNINPNTRVSAEQTQANVEAYLALKKIPDYVPINPEHSVEAATLCYEELLAAEEALIHADNAAAAVRYLKIFNKNAAPTVGTDTPVLNLPMPPSALFRFDLSDIGLHLTSGLAFAITTGNADKDTGAVTANDIVGLNIVYA